MFSATSNHHYRKENVILIKLFYSVVAYWAIVSIFFQMAFHFLLHRDLILKFPSAMLCLKKPYLKLSRLLPDVLPSKSVLQGKNLWIHTFLCTLVELELLSPIFQSEPLAITPTYLQLLFFLYNTICLCLLSLIAYCTVYTRLYEMIYEIIERCIHSFPEFYSSEAN